MTGDGAKQALIYIFFHPRRAVLSYLIERTLIWVEIWPFSPPEGRHYLATHSCNVLTAIQSCQKNPVKKRAFFQQQHLRREEKYARIINQKSKEKKNLSVAMSVRTIQAVLLGVNKANWPTYHWKSSPESRGNPRCHRDNIPHQRRLFHSTHYQHVATFHHFSSHSNQDKSGWSDNKWLQISCLFCLEPDGPTGWVMCCTKSFQHQFPSTFSKSTRNYFSPTVRLHRNKRQLHTRLRKLLTNRLALNCWYFTLHCSTTILNLWTQFPE